MLGNMTSTNITPPVQTLAASLAIYVRLLSLAVTVCLWLPVSALATDILTDGQLDEISAMGDFSVNIGEGQNGLPTVNFGFQTGGTTGNGQIILQPSTTPTTAIGATNVNFNAPFHVDNMILNMNICVQCQANTLTQGNVGVPITVKVVP